MSSTSSFSSEFYSEITRARLVHLNKMNLPIWNMSVLEVGSGIGDFLKFFLERKCNVDSTDGREELVNFMKDKFQETPELNFFVLDMENPSSEKNYDIVFCYGLLYHLENPEQAIEFMHSVCNNMLILETCVSNGTVDSINVCDEDKMDYTQSISGKGCRPSRQWIFRELKKRFHYVYVPKSQPSHSQFPLDWNKVNTDDNNRAIFIASRNSIDNNLMVEELIDIHERLA